MTEQKWQKEQRKYLEDDKARYQNLKNAYTNFKKQINNLKLTDAQKLQIVQFNLTKLSNTEGLSLWVANLKDFKPMLIEMVKYNRANPQRLQRGRYGFGGQELDHEENILKWVKAHPAMRWYLSDSDDSLAQSLDNAKMSADGNRTKNIMDVRDDYLYDINIVKPDDLDTIYNELLDECRDEIDTDS